MRRRKRLRSSARPFNEAIAALLALLTAACSGPGAVLSPNPSPSIAPSTEGTACRAPRDPQVAPTGDARSAVIALGCEAGAVAAGGGSVWVVPHLDRVALRIDPATNTVIDRIPLGDGGPGAEIAASDDMVWASVSSASYDLDRLVRIDPVSGAVVASLELAAGNPVIGAGFAWAGTADTVYRIDTATNTLGASVPVGFGCWVTILEDLVFCIGTGRAVEIDPSTDDLLPIQGVPFGLPVEADDGLIWGVNVDSLWAFDTTTGQIAADLRPPTGSTAWALDAVVVDGALWATASVREGPPDRLVRIDRERMEIDCVIETPVAEFGVASGLGSIWYPVLRQPWVLRIDPAC
jgi:hypothetical protein